MRCGNEFRRDRVEALERANGCAGDDESSALTDVTDDAVRGSGEPERNARVQDLVGGGVPAPLQDQGAGASRFRVSRQWLVSPPGV